jgi:hypothetical protein
VLAFGAAEGVEQAARRAVLEDVVTAGVGVSVVGDPQVPAAVDGESLRFADAGGNRLGERAVLAEFLDPVVEGVGDIDGAVAVDRDALGLGELAVAGARAADRLDELAGRREFLDPLVAGVGYVHVAAADRDRLRIVEPAGVAAFTAERLQGLARR